MKESLKKVLSTIKWLIWEGNLKTLMFWGCFVFVVLFFMNALAVEGIVQLDIGEIWGTHLPCAPLYVPMVSTFFGVLMCMVSISLHEALTSDKGFCFRNLLAGTLPCIVFCIVMLCWRGFL